MTFTAAKDLDALLEVSVYLMQYNIQLLLCSLLIRDTLMLRLDKMFTFVLDLTMNTLS